MSNKTFGAALLAACIGASPFILFFWIWLVATVDFSDILVVVCVAVVKYELRVFRREDRAMYRAIRRVQARDIQKSSRRGVSLLTDEDDETSMAA